MDAAEFLFPHDLAVSETPLSKVLLVGSCVAEHYLKHFREIAPQVAFDWIMFSNPGELPALAEPVIRAYDFQYIQLSLRHVVRDEVINFGGFLSDGVAEAIRARSRQLLQLILDSALQYNKSHGLLTFVTNFWVPQVPVVAALNQNGSVHDFASIVRQLNEDLAALVGQYRNVYIADVESVGNSLGKRYFLEDVVGFYSHSAIWGQWYHAFDTSAACNAPPGGRLDPLVPMEDVYGSGVDELFRALWRQAECLFRTVHQVDMVKLVVFDLDDTLWRGQIAEHYADGMPTPVWHGWVVGIWEAVQHLRARGIITAICSKNDEGLVQARWGRAVMPWLSIEDFPLRQINWRPKAENIGRIIKAASVTPKSVVFVDDNPVERESVRMALPGIRVIGSNPHATRRILLWSPETQLAFRSSETANREQSVRKLQQREQDRTALSREDFLASLGCTVALREVASRDDADFARSLELLNKTNQFNTNGVRWSDSQVSVFFGVGGKLFVFRVKDRYTDYGLVGAILYRDGLFVQVVMSCRVLGLDVETSVIHEIMQAERARGARPYFLARVSETDANMVCRDLFTRCGFDDGTGETGFQVWASATVPLPAAHLRIESPIIRPMLLATVAA